MALGQHERVPATTLTMAAAPDAAAPAPSLARGLKTRILSLDAFRGFVMLLMLAEASLMNVAGRITQPFCVVPSTPLTSRGRLFPHER